MSYEWEDFYLAYSDQESDLKSRLSVIRQYVKKELASNPKVVLSICGGRGLDLVDLTESQSAYIIDNDNIVGCIQYKTFWKLLNEGLLIRSEETLSYITYKVKEEIKDIHNDMLEGRR